MKPETKAHYEDFTIRWGQYVPAEKRPEFIIETSMIMAEFARDNFEEFMERMAAGSMDASEKRT